MLSFCQLIDTSIVQSRFKPRVNKEKSDPNTFFDRPAHIDAELWPEVQDLVTALFEEQEWFDTLSSNDIY